jgi:hypothetical protein
MILQNAHGDSLLLLHLLLSCRLIHVHRLLLEIGGGGGRIINMWKRERNGEKKKDREMVVEVGVSRGCLVEMGGGANT